MSYRPKRSMKMKKNQTLCLIVSQIVEPEISYCVNKYLELGLFVRILFFGTVNDRFTGTVVKFDRHGTNRVEVLPLLLLCKKDPDNPPNLRNIVSYDRYHLYHFHFTSDNNYNNHRHSGS